MDVQTAIFCIKTCGQKRTQEKGLWINVHVKNMASSRTLQDKDFLHLHCIFNKHRQAETQTHIHKLVHNKTIVSIWHTHTKNNGKLCIVLYFFQLCFVIVESKRKYITMSVTTHSDLDLICHEKLSWVNKLCPLSFIKPDT